MRFKNIPESVAALVFFSLSELVVKAFPPLTFAMVTDFLDVLVLGSLLSTILYYVGTWTASLKGTKKKTVNKRLIQVGSVGVFVYLLYGTVRFRL